MFDLIGYRELVDSFYDHMVNVPEATAGIRPSEDKWCLKEIIGHLVDSASNNHQRFVRLQFGDLLDFPAYDGEEWVRKQKYREMNWNRLILLWHNYNCVLLNIIENMDGGAYSNVWVKGEDTIQLDELVVDYYRHMRAHRQHFEERLKEVGENA
jgi:hypothetical protein